MFNAFEKLKNSLSKTKDNIFGKISQVVSRRKIDDDLLDEIEEILIEADVGVKATMKLIENIKEKARELKLSEGEEIIALLKQEISAILVRDNTPLFFDNDPKPVVWLIVGVNGVGKTTTIGKLATRFSQENKKVIIAACDTFRAAAIDQLKIWGQRAGCNVIAHQPGADPGAVVYDAIRAARSRGADILIVDTAGRLHTKYNLMQELKKVRGVAAKQVHQAPHETLLVLDATTGQNALAQARHFKNDVEVTGIFLAKLDGTAKGGVVFAIARELGLPIRFVGTGEGLDDLAEFDPEVFVEGLFST